MNSQMEVIGKMRLKNKKIIVTAAAQGIGRSTALAFANEGAEVVATDINAEKLEELKVLNNNISTSLLDSSKKDDVENLIGWQFDIYQILAVLLLCTS